MKTWLEAYCKDCKQRTAVHVFGTWGNTNVCTPQPKALYEWLMQHAACRSLALAFEDHQHEALWEEIGYVASTDLLTLWDEERGRVHKYPPWLED